MPNLDTPAPAAPGPPDPAGSRFLGGPAQLSVSWVWEECQAVAVQLLSLTTLPACLIHRCRLSMKTAPACRFCIPAQIIGPQERNVEFVLEYDLDDRMLLHADIPLDTNQWFRDVLSTWSDPPKPEWPVDPNDWHGSDGHDSLS